MISFTTGLYLEKDLVAQINFSINWTNYTAFIKMDSIQDLRVIGFSKVGAQVNAFFAFRPPRLNSLYVSGFIIIISSGSSLSSQACTDVIIFSSVQQATIDTAFLTSFLNKEANKICGANVPAHLSTSFTKEDIYNAAQNPSLPLRYRIPNIQSSLIYNITIFPYLLTTLGRSSSIHFQQFGS
ncbi:unnamed protein product [Protopolystoma xenopodis]|uniref:Uncharacterized protein n=1 Tax=Protopolystoma xenopodis TaxID=117903 RepID=A0A448XIL8_9PLAT|nr:unnamed protein product [Protopolystoma xenopodis]